MAQKDIQDIADFMKSADESIAAEDKSYDEACEECKEQQALEYEELEDEVIDKASLGFIDDADLQAAESDDFYNEDAKDPFAEDVTEFAQQEVIDEEPMASIDVEVYNEDDYGKFFTRDLNKQLPNVVATVKKQLPNGDLLVKIHGKKDDLENAFAFYIGKSEFDKLSQKDKEDFESRLVFDDGDTLAEADYREAVAHCLDPIGVKASTANLADQDTCAISVIKEEKAKRFAKKALKCLRENDFSSLSDQELDALDSLKDAIDGDKPLDVNLMPVWKVMLDDMGYTMKEWAAMTPEEREKALAYGNEPLSKTGFADPIHVGFDPKTGKKFKFRINYEVFDPETGERNVTAFNPDYDMEHSLNLHPAQERKRQKKAAKDAEQAEKILTALQAMKKVRGRKETWDMYEFALMLAGLDGKQRKELMNELIADVEKDNEGNPRKAGEEIMFIKSMFGKKITLRDIAKAWDASAPGVMKFANETMAIWKRSLAEAGIKSRAELFRNREKFNLFKEILAKNMAARRKGSIVSGK